MESARRSAQWRLCRSKEGHASAVRCAVTADMSALGSRRSVLGAVIPVLRAAIVLDGGRHRSVRGADADRQRADGAQGNQRHEQDDDQETETHAADYDTGEKAGFLQPRLDSAAQRPRNAWRTFPPAVRTADSGPQRQRTQRQGWQVMGAV